MLEVCDTALILMAAGRSMRFTDGDKLAEPFLDKPLAFHIVTALEDMPFLARIAVVSYTQLDFAALGYSIASNPEPERGMARSLCFGVRDARDRGAKAVLVVLADMPRVTAAHIHRLFDAVRKPDDIVASSDGTRPLPPALFQAVHFDALMRLEGDQGARRMIAGGRHVVTSPDELFDVDTRENLETLRARFDRRVSQGLAQS